MKVTVLLMHYPKDDLWSAHIPYCHSILEDGETPEKATENMIETIKDVIKEYPEIKEQLITHPECLITEVNI